MKLHEKLRPHTHIAQIKAKAYAESKTITIEPIKRQLCGYFNNIDRKRTPVVSLCCSHGGAESECCSNGLSSTVNLLFFKKTISSIRPSQLF